MLAKTCSGNVLPDPHPTSYSLDTKVIITTRVPLEDTFYTSVSDNTFRALNVAIFEKLKFVCGNYLSQER